jgi:hypothetical protein
MHNRASLVDRTSRWLAEPRQVPRLAVLLCVGVATVGTLVRYPQAISDLTNTARTNAAQSFADREIAGGNSVIPDQQLLYQARARIPRGAAYEVVVGDPVEGWSDLTRDHAGGFARYFLMPRRPSVGAPWVLCLNCGFQQDVGETVWAGEDAVSIIKRPE